MCDYAVVTRKQAKLLAQNVREQLNEYHWQRVFYQFECLMRDDFHGPKGASPALIPYAPGAKRGVVYFGSEENGSYNHHNQINKFKGKYYYAWSNGFRNEEDAGQRVLVASSDNALHWSAPSVLLDVPAGSPWAHNCVALHTDDEAMYCVIMSEETEHDETVTGMRRVKPEDAYIDVYKTTDGTNWAKAFSFGTAIKWIFEAPRLTQDGRLMCVCNTKRDGPAIMLWPGKDICATPQLIHVPEPEGAWFPYGESTWYQLDCGRIMVFWRDEGASLRLYVNHSDDGGQTWSEPVLTDIPDSMSRLYAGRLTDGRYFLVNNAIGTLLDRTPLMLLLSDDGVLFSKVYIVNDTPCVMRRKGLLKANGNQYPCCLVDGDNLIVAYDENKEDIFVEVIDTRKI